MPTPLELADLQARTLCVHDDQDRLLRRSGADGSPAPWVLVIRTADGPLVRCRADAAPELVREAEALAAALPALDPSEPKLEWASEALEALVARHVPVTRRWAGPAYTFPLELPDHRGAVPYRPEDAGLLHPTLDWVAKEYPAGEPFRGTVIDGQIVAICHAPAVSAGAAEAGVETVEAFRGRGAAGPAVLAWAVAIREGGRVPIYSTWWENTASQAVARKLRLVLFGEDLHIT